MDKIRMGMPDGNGVFGSFEFWNNYCNDIGVELVDTEDNLETLTDLSNTVFPKQICLNSKYRLGRALLLAKQVTHLLFFIRQDKYVSNCPASVYRINWVKEYFKGKVDVIIWKKDLFPKESDFENLVELSNRLGRDSGVIKSKYDPEHFIKLPQREAVYDLSLDEANKQKKKKIMLIGVVPHLIDPYRKTALMDYMCHEANIITPYSISSNYNLKEKSPDDLIFYKEEAILNSIGVTINKSLVDGYVFVSDPFDIPGKYSFPKIKMFLETNGIFDINNERAKRRKYTDLTVNIFNFAYVKEKFDYFINSI